jgi:predicted membrane protein
MSLMPGASDIAHVVQLSVAPVFLLTGIGAMLSVLSFRLGRAVDRARVLEALLPTLVDARRIDYTRKELSVLSTRARLINWAITLCTTSALLVCLVIVVLFVGALAALDIAIAIATLFIFSMVTLIGSLLIFLREVQLATAHLRIGTHED